MLGSPYIFSFVVGVAAFAITFWFVEQEIRRWPRYKRWTDQKVTERCSLASGLFFGLTTLVYNLV